MKPTTEAKETITIEAITKHISILDIPDFRKSLREMMDGYFLNSSETGADPEPAWCAFRAVDTLLEMIQEFKQSQAV